MDSGEWPDAARSPAAVAEERMLAALSLPAWICRTETMEILAANAAAARLLGAALDALPGRLLARGRPAPASGQVISAWPADDAGGDRMWRLLRPDGSEVEVCVSVAALDDSATGRSLVTAHPAAPVARPAPRRSEEELLRDAKRESLELLAGGVAHDFNNLLTALLGNIGLARMDTAAAAEAQEWLAEAEKAAGRARDLTQQLLTFVKGGEPVRRLVELGGPLREAAQFARQGSRVRCEFALVPDLWPAEVDAGQIGQVVHNLVLNAVQAMKGGGVVTVSARNVSRDDARRLGLGPHHFVVVEVRDQGPGIRPEDMARIFQPYFTTKSAGSGLGLATSQTIARRHFGALRVESEPGRGAAFLLFLPAKPGARVERAAGETEIPMLEGRVLFMDDEPSIRQMAPNLLRRIGFETEVAGDGREAIAAYVRAMGENRRFDVLILDLTVPAGMGAIDALKRLREIDPGVQAVVSSGYADDPVLLDFRDHGFCGAVTRPYCLSELAGVLGRVLKGDETTA